jgi:hypothetical protein
MFRIRSLLGDGDLAGVSWLMGRISGQGFEFAIIRDTFPAVKSNDRIYPPALQDVVSGEVMMVRSAFMQAGLVSFAQARLLALRTRQQVFGSS